MLGCGGSAVKISLCSKNQLPENGPRAKMITRGDINNNNKSVPVARGGWGGGRFLRPGMPRPEMGGHASLCMYVRDFDFVMCFRRVRDFVDFVIS